MKTWWVVWLTVTWSFGAFGQGTLNFANANSAVALDAPILGLDGKTGLQGTGWMVELWAGPTLDSLAPVARTTSFSTEAPGYFNGGVVSIPNIAPGSNAWCVVCAHPSSVVFDGPYNWFYGASAPFQVTLGGGYYKGPPGLPAALTGLSSFDVAVRFQSHLTGTNTLSLTWAGFPDGHFQLEQSPDLDPGHWVALTNAPHVGGYVLLGEFSVTVPAPQGSMFYRLIQFPQPGHF